MAFLVNLIKLVPGAMWIGNKANASLKLLILIKFIKKTLAILIKQHIKCIKSMRGVKIIARFGAIEKARNHKRGSSLASRRPNII